MRALIAAFGLVMASSTVASASTTFDFNDGTLGGLTEVGGMTDYSVASSCNSLSNGTDFLCATGTPGGYSTMLFDFPDLGFDGFKSLEVSLDIAGVATNNGDILEPIGANYADFVLIQDGGNKIEIGGDEITGSFVTHTFDLAGFLPTDGASFQLGVQVSGNSEFIGIDNISFSGSVPEPSTWLMMLAGFGLTGLALKRRKVAVAA